MNRIVEAHRRGFSDRLRTLANLDTFFQSLSLDDQRQLCEYLEDMLRTESLDTKYVRTAGVNTVALALIALAQFGPTNHLAEFIFSRIQLDDPKLMEVWASEVYHNLKFCLYQYQSRFSDQSLNQIKYNCAKYRPTDRPLPLSLVEALTDLESTVEQVEFERFEQTLRRPTKWPRTGELESVLVEVGSSKEIAAAMKEAESYLHSGGPFNPKKAADLLRASMDETHRIVVTELEKVKNKPYAGIDKDGDRRAYMRASGFISKAEEKFFSAIYSLISEEASHKLVAPRETVLVLHSTVSNYLLLLLRRLDEWRLTKTK